jgi:hypothetical protein
MACTAFPIFSRTCLLIGQWWREAEIRQIKDGGEVRKQKTAQRYYLMPIPQQLALILNHLSFRWTQLLGLRGLNMKSVSSVSVLEHISAYRKPESQTVFINSEA